MANMDKAVKQLHDAFNSGIAGSFFSENKHMEYMVLSYIADRCRRYIGNEQYDMEVGADHGKIIIDVTTPSKTLKPIIITKELIEKTIESWDLFD